MSWDKVGIVYYVFWLCFQVSVLNVEGKLFKLYITSSVSEDHGLMDIIDHH